jgi:hypothetical protein
VTDGGRRGDSKYRSAARHHVAGGCNRRGVPTLISPADQLGAAGLSSRTTEGDQLNG